MASLLVLRLVYLALVTPLVLYGLGTFYLLYVYLRHGHRRPEKPATPDDRLPRVAVQIPLYNEQHVARRVITAAAALDYPRDRLSIQVLDDSVDETAALVDDLLSTLCADHLHIEVVRRPKREGYKGGALANGFARTDADIIAIFDADFVPRPDFLRQAVPYFLAHPAIGAVQCRWGHLNADANWLTRSQAVMLDGHFAIEQAARSAGGLLFSFNGTCGLLRRQCIEDAGGWTYDTLTEDADLSYRAQIKGWRFVFVPDIVTPGELPPQMVGFKLQQARWATGTTQVLMKMLRRIWRARLTLRQRLMATVSLSAYPIQPLGLLMFLLMPYLLCFGVLDGLPLAPLGLLTAAVPILYGLGQYVLYPDTWRRRIVALPVLIVISTGLSLNNSLAVLRAVRGDAGPFQRTAKFNLGPKTHPTWRASMYAGVRDRLLWGELALGLYALAGMVIAAQRGPGLIPYFGLYALGFFVVAAWSVADQVAHQRAAQPG
ncbi:MAG: glycosyltransferase [Anaerolineae bacterium]|nr:glycosyltransferase [Anaerolineae bacterium]